MTIFYSDLFSTQSPATEPEFGFLPDVSTCGGRILYKRALMTVDGTVWDSAAIWRFMTFHSSDRLLELRLSFENGTGGTLVLGLSESKAVEAGLTVINGVYAGTLFVDGLSMTRSVMTSVDVLTSSTSEHSSGDVDNVDRGKRLWELANRVSGGSEYTSDPDDTFDIIGYINTTVGTKPTECVIVVEAYYVQGGDRL